MILGAFLIFWRSRVFFETVLFFGSLCATAVYLVGELVPSHIIFYTHWVSNDGEVTGTKIQKEVVSSRSGCVDRQTHCSVERNAVLLEDLLLVRLELLDRVRGQRRLDRLDLKSFHFFSELFPPFFLRGKKCYSISMRNISQIFFRGVFF